MLFQAFHVQLFDLTGVQEAPHACEWTLHLNESIGHVGIDEGLDGRARQIQVILETIAPPERHRQLCFNARLLYLGLHGLRRALWRLRWLFWRRGCLWRL